MRGSQYRRSEGKAEQKSNFVTRNASSDHQSDNYSETSLTSFLQGTSTVAVKTLKESASEKERKDLLQVARTALTSIFWKPTDKYAFTTLSSSSSSSSSS